MQTKQTLKSILPYIIIGILILILFFIMKDCSHKSNLVEDTRQYYSANGSAGVFRTADLSTWTNEARQSRQ